MYEELKTITVVRHLPEERLTPAPAWSFTNLDFFPI